MFIDETIYRTNGFRILGLDITSSNTKIENRIAQIDFYRARKNFKDYEPLIGAFDKSKTDFLLPVRPEPSYNEYQNAKNRLYDVERRFMDELFWFWPQSVDGQLDEEIVEYLKENNYAKAIRYWEDTFDTYPVDISSIHNLAVLYHMRALDGFFEGEGNKKLFDDLELSLNYWCKLLKSDAFKEYVKKRADSINDPRLNEEFMDEVFSELPENLLNINYIYVKKYLNSKKLSKRNQDHLYRHIDCIKNSPFDKAIVGRFSSKIIDDIDKRITECEKSAKEAIGCTFDDQKRYDIAIEHYERILPYLKVLHMTFKDDIISETVLNDSCDFIYNKIPTASSISSIKEVNEDKYNKYIEILEMLDEYATDRKILEKIQPALCYLIHSGEEHDIEISVYNHDGNALSEVNVSMTNIYTDKSYVTTTDSTGTCKISQLPQGKYYYSIEKKGYYPNDGKIDVVDDSTLNIRLKEVKPKPKRYSVDVIIHDEKGNILSDVKVSMTNTQRDRTYTATTDSSGFCRINNLPIGKYRFKVQKNGYNSHDGRQYVFEDSKLNIKLKKKHQSLHSKRYYPD